mmetsp:Transcript_32248/g.56993  ORF Transcript_32248/g.56993 Transcript_32248/m.56993 type:complete len:224 (-) Transcript_32248:136-807(-)
MNFKDAQVSWAHCLSITNCQWMLLQGTRHQAAPHVHNCKASPFCSFDGIRWEKRSAAKYFPELIVVARGLCELLQTQRAAIESVIAMYEAYWLQHGSAVLDFLSFCMTFVRADVVIEACHKISTCDFLHQSSTLSIVIFQDGVDVIEALALECGRCISQREAMVVQSSIDTPRIVHCHLFWNLFHPNPFIVISVAQTLGIQLAICDQGVLSPLLRLVIHSCRY